jgi:hypothetical protein
MTIKMCGERRRQNPPFTLTNAVYHRHDDDHSPFFTAKKSRHSSMKTNIPMKRRKKGDKTITEDDDKKVTDPTK